MSRKKISSPADLKALREKAVAQIELRSGNKDLRVSVHMGTCGIAAGARDVLTELMNLLSAAGARNIAAQQSGCAGLCDQEPMISLTDKSGAVFRYGKCDKDRVRRIVQEHVLGGKVVNEYLLKA